MPTQSSLAAGIIQTAYRLSVAIGLGITSAVYTTVQSTHRGIVDDTFPFQRVYICGVGFATFGILFIPFMNLEMQGGKETKRSSAIVENTFFDQEAQDYTPRAAGEYRDVAVESPLQTLGSKASQSTLGTVATYGSEETYFQRWSWEDDPYWPRKSNGYNEHTGASGMAYEVCIKCLEERRIILPIAAPDREEKYTSRLSTHPSHGGWI